MYLSDLWAWPDLSLPHAVRDRALRDLCHYLADNLASLCGAAAHPLELGLRLHHAACHGDDRGVPSILARAMCASPFDAALHDAAGLALERSAFEFYGEPAAFPSADPYFDGGACAAIARVLRRPTAIESPAWIIVNKADNLEEKVAPWVKRRGYRCFKLKIMGKDNAVDAARTVDVFRAVREFGAADPQLTVDSNEANPRCSQRDRLPRTSAGA